jgi:hypothetical protein
VINSNNMPTVSELLVEAKHLQIHNYHKLNKAELIKAIDEYVYPLLYIYPKKNVTCPVNDDVTRNFKSNVKRDNTRGAYNKRGNFDIGSAFMGHHTCICGETSEGQDYLLTTPSGKRYATHTLCVHYLRDHREEIPHEEMENVKEFLKSFE